MAMLAKRLYSPHLLLDNKRSVNAYPGHAGRGLADRSAVQHGAAAVGEGEGGGERGGEPRAVAVGGQGDT